jgi:hypothetical protein
MPTLQTVREGTGVNTKSMDQAQGEALVNGDWIAAAMSQVVIGPKTVNFSGTHFAYHLDDNGSMHRLDPRIKYAALDFGLDWKQIERFYGRVCKRVARHIAKEKRSQKGEFYAT